MWKPNDCKCLQTFGKTVWETTVSSVSIKKRRQMMKKMYNRQYLEDSLYLLKANIDDLARWSVYNNDAYLYEIANMKDQITEITEKLEKYAKEGGE